MSLGRSGAGGKFRGGCKAEIDISVSIADVVAELKDFLNSRLYKHTNLVGMSEWARQIMESIFGKLKADPSLMPARFQEMLLTEEKEIVIADYIAGMTDRFAIKMYEELG